LEEAVSHSPFEMNSGTSLADASSTRLIHLRSKGTRVTGSLQLSIACPSTSLTQVTVALEQYHGTGAERVSGPRSCPHTDLKFGWRTSF